MSGFIPGQGTKKPLNMLQSPIYPDIKQQYPEFKWSKKHWTVDVGQTLLDTEANTHIYEDAVLSRSYRENIDKYGQSSHQEKITVFRPPLQNSYEDFGPLNRLPVKLHAIVPRINPGTTDSAGGTNAFRVNNSATQEISRFITDRITSESWHQTYYMPIDTSLDNVVLPDLVTTMPSYSTSSGYEMITKFDAPHAMNGYVIEKVNLPKTSAHSGFTTPLTVNGQTRLDDLEFETNMPSYSVSSGIETYIKIDGDNGMSNLHFDPNRPEMSMSSGFNTPLTVNGETRLNDIVLEQHPEARLGIVNPGSEDGYHTRIDSYTPPQNYIKLRENPQVSTVAHASFDYKNVNNQVKPHFQTKLLPVKSYGNGLGGGTIKTAGVEQPRIGSRFFHSKSEPVY